MEERITAKSAADLIPNSWELGRGSKYIEFAFFTSTLGLVGEPIQKSLENLNPVFENTNTFSYAARFHEKWEVQKSELLPVPTDEGIIIEGTISKKANPPGYYLIIMVAFENEEEENRNRIKINAIRSIIVSLYGELSALKNVGGFIYRKSEDKITSTSNVIRNPHQESQIYMVSKKLYDCFKNLKVVDNDERIERAFHYFNKGIDELNWSLKMFFYYLSIECISGSNTGISRPIWKVYREKFKTQHEMNEFFNLKSLDKIRNDFSHRATESDQNGYLERLIQILFIDCILYYVANQRAYQALHFVENAQRD